MMVLSQRFLSELRSRVGAGEPQYRIARRAGIHPSTLSQIVNDAIPIKVGDRRVIRIAAELGLSPEEAFNQDEADE